MVVRSIAPLIQGLRAQNSGSAAYDYILARIETSTNPSTLKGYVVRKYDHRKGRITERPLREMRAPSIRDLEDKIVPNNCVNWGINDQVIGYRGPRISEDQKISICPVSREELQEYINLLKEVKLRLR